MAFAGLNMPWIDVCPFKSCEEELTWGSIIAVRPRKYQWNLLLLEQPHCCLATVVWGVIDQNDCISPPVLSLFIQFSNQILEENLHNLGIAIRLDN